MQSVVNFVKSYNYNLGGNYEIKKLNGIFYKFTKTETGKKTFVPEYDMKDIEGLSSDLTQLKEIPVLENAPTVEEQKKMDELSLKMMITSIDEQKRRNAMMIRRGREEAEKEYQGRATSMQVPPAAASRSWWGWKRGGRKTRRTRRTKGKTRRTKGKTRRSKA
jgi:hypothetical protein